MEDICSHCSQISKWTSYYINTTCISRTENTDERNSRISLYKFWNKSWCTMMINLIALTFCCDEFRHSCLVWIFTAQRTHQSCKILCSSKTFSCYCTPDLIKKVYKSLFVVMSLQIVRNLANSKIIYQNQIDPWICFIICMCV